MRLLAIDDLDLNKLSLPEMPMILDTSDRFAWQTRRQDGSGGSMFVTASRDIATYECVVSCDSTKDRDDLLAVLSVDIDVPRRIIAKRLDENETIVQTDAAITRVTLITETSFQLTMEASDSVWTEVTPAMTQKQFAVAGDRAMSLTIPGNTRTKPKIVINPSTQRTAPTAFAGYKWRTRWRITNTGDLPWYRRPIRIDFGDGSALVSASKMLSNGNDLRVWLDGIEQPRRVIGPNTATTTVWVVAPYIPAGGSVTYDIVYGNPSAGNNAEFFYPDTPVIDMVFSGNFDWYYPDMNDLTAYTDTQSPGLWWLSNNAQQATPDYSVPGAWHPVRTRRNPDSKYLSYSRPFQDAPDGPGPIMAYPSLGIAHADNIGAGGVATLDASLVNGYDGIGFYSPVPISSWSIDYRLQNDNGVAKIVALGRESPSTDWLIYAATTTTATNTTTTGVTGGSANSGVAMHEIALALWPANGWEIPDTDTPSADVAKLDMDVTDGTAVLTLSFVLWASFIDIDQIETETQIYEFASELAIGGGESHVPPYTALQIGNAALDRGTGARRAACKMSECLVVDCERGVVEVWTQVSAVPVALVETIPAVAVRGIKGWDNDGVTVQSPVNEWLSLSPRVTQVANDTFDAGIAGWSAGNTSGGSAAVTWSWDSGIGGVVNGALKAAFSGTTSSGAIARRISDQVFSFYNRKSIDVVAWVTTSHANLVPLLGVQFYSDDEGSVAAAEVLGAIWTPATSTEYEIAASAAVPSNARSYRLVLAVNATAGNPTGNVWFDDIRLNGGVLLFRDEAIGSIRINTYVPGAWL